jgi:hypothetical protein
VGDIVEGTSVGNCVGLDVGADEFVGDIVEGTSVGNGAGLDVGADEFVGDIVEGTSVGNCVGLDVGADEFVGDIVGFPVGAVVLDASTPPSWHISATNITIIVSMRVVTFI